jgi:ribosomal protein S18 acetylase RimI-like enzyme
MIRNGRILLRRNELSSVAMEVRRLLPADNALYREIRLEALRLAPEAFSSDYARESAEPESWFAARLDGAAIFGAFVGSAPVGIAGFFAHKASKEAHKGVLFGMYVRPQARRNGIGRRLVEVVIDHAHRQVELLQLSVVSSNAAARRLYSALGFVEYGIEKNALKEDGRYWDEVLMAKSLLSARPGP